MARIDGKQENQHYVPRFLLKNFASRNRSNEHHIYTFDKHNDNVFEPNISSINSEVGFYDFYLGGENRSLESALTDLENDTSQVIKKIIENENLSCLSNEDRAQVALYVAVQYLRVKKQREIIKQFMKEYEDRIRKMGYKPEEVEGFSNLSDEQIKMLTLESFHKHSVLYADFIFKKMWVLLKDDGDNLFISDNPVVLHNDKKFGPYGNIGFALPGIQIYFPISKNLTLGFLCPSFLADLEENVKEIEKIETNAKAHLLLNRNADPNKLKEVLEMVDVQKSKPLNFLNKYKNGEVIALHPQTVTFLNSLQVLWSHRFVLSSKNNFDLVRQMISDNEFYRTGMKINVS